ncbi:30S ribosomal protein S6 [Candidatus Peregrinibacteria bacterium CG10_big_fil_rev_8_21_14_0_10_49_16]|nr:MAG: 30S ribosomal protein S6 [Candidatus Peregrinibacteria bacterium CG22_combo_CG10-13_8_21_14_all_49_11]PIR52251.1 MAG: 30S ribosomal protein S6 [Candidatus Peregrinibacteria bacterium CG10_big_fil_rev_8_21_14_0_10_49_16]
MADTDLIDTAEEKDTRLYECVVLYEYPCPQGDESKLLKEIEGIFEEAGGTLVDKDPWSRRGLAYPIAGHHEGKYIVYYYEVDPKNIRTVDEALRIAKGVLRHMLIKPDTGYKVEKYEEKFQQWLKSREAEEQARLRQHEEELKAQVIERAKQKAKKAETSRRIQKEEVKEEELEEHLEKIISDDDLQL